MTLFIRLQHLLTIAAISFILPHTAMSLTFPERIDTARQLTQQAESYKADGDLVNAEKTYFQAIRTYNEDWVWSSLAFFYAETEQYEKVLKVTEGKMRNKFPHSMQTVALIHNKAIDSLPPKKTEGISKIKSRYKAARRVLVSEHKSKKLTKEELAAIGTRRSSSGQTENDKLVLVDDIDSRCSLKWGANYQMVEHCTETQREAMAIVAQMPKNIISERCLNKWGTDYVMVDHCLKTQIQAVNNIANRETDEITVFCLNKWDSNYEMVEHCVSQQNQAKYNIQRSHSNSPYKKRCENKWGNNYQMVEHCIKN